MLLPPTTTSSQAAMDSQATTVIQAATDISGLREVGGTLIVLSLYMFDLCTLPADIAVSAMAGRVHCVG